MHSSALSTSGPDLPTTCHPVLKLGPFLQEPSLSLSLGVSEILPRMQWPCEDPLVTHTWPSFWSFLSRPSSLLHPVETEASLPYPCSISEPVHPNRSRAQLTCLLFVRTTVLEALIVANNKALCLLPCFLQFILSLPAPQLSFAAAAAAKSLQSGPTLSDPIDGSPPGSPVPGILQARTLEWVAISFSNV